MSTKGELELACKKAKDYSKADRFGSRYYVFKKKGWEPRVTCNELTVAKLVKERWTLHQIYKAGNETV